MLRHLNKNKGQAVIGEYVLLFAIVASVIAGMVVYARRTMQARLRDAQMTMVDTVFTYVTSTGEKAGHQGGIYLHYEPYFVNQTAVADRQQESSTSLLRGGTTGIYRKEIDDKSYVQSHSEQLPPKEAH